jgi:hypothetical protein
MILVYESIATSNRIILVASSVNLGQWSIWEYGFDVGDIEIIAHPTKAWQTTYIVDVLNIVYWIQMICINSHAYALQWESLREIINRISVFLITGLGLRLTNFVLASDEHITSSSKIQYVLEVICRSFSCSQIWFSLGELLFIIIIEFWHPPWERKKRFQTHFMTQY